MFRGVGFLILTIVPLFGQGQVREFLDLSYMNSPAGQDTLQRLNLVLPEEEGLFPLLLWIGGGAWSYVDKDVEMDLARNLAKRGIGVATIGHRLSSAVWRDPKLSSGVQHPAHVEDIASATRWLMNNADRYHYSLADVFIGGYSSGAHLAALITMDSSYLNQEGLSPGVFKGVIPISGAFDILAYHDVFLQGERPQMAEQHVEAVFGSNDQQMIDASPTSYLDHLTIPMLLMCDNDLYNYTRLFEDRIRETPFRDIRVVYAYNFSHSGLWRDLSSPNESLPQHHH